MTPVREMVAGWIGELPPNTIVWRTMSRDYTATELVEEIEKGTDGGMQYTIELFRVARDLIARQAHKR